MRVGVLKTPALRVVKRIAFRHGEDRLAPFPPDGWGSPHFLVPINQTHKDTYDRYYALGKLKRDRFEEGQR